MVTAEAKRDQKLSLQLSRSEWLCCFRPFTQLLSRKIEKYSNEKDAAK